MLCILFLTYPCSKDIDEEYLNELSIIKKLNINYVLYDIEDNQIYGSIDNALILYRGWMLNDN